MADTAATVATDMAVTADGGKENRPLNKSTFEPNDKLHFIFAKTSDFSLSYCLLDSALLVVGRCENVEIFK